jgi:anti-sigma28 factor (negative regulator of flagellin synthesis)
VGEEERKKIDRRPPERRPPDPADKDAREAYLRRLRMEIEQGLYKVPADWIAEKIIETELE